MRKVINCQTANAHLVLCLCSNQKYVSLAFSFSQAMREERWLSCVAIFIASLRLRVNATPAYLVLISRWEHWKCWRKINIWTLVAKCVSFKETSFWRTQTFCEKVGQPRMPACVLGPNASLLASKILTRKQQRKSFCPRKPFEHCLFGRSIMSFRMTRATGKSLFQKRIQCSLMMEKYPSVSPENVLPGLKLKAEIWRIFLSENECSWRSKSSFVEFWQRSLSKRNRITLHLWLVWDTGPTFCLIYRRNVWQLFGWATSGTIHLSLLMRVLR